MDVHPPRPVAHPGRLINRGRGGRERAAATDERVAIEQVADRWRVFRSEVYALVAAGELPCIRIGLDRGALVRSTSPESTWHAGA